MKILFLGDIFGEAGYLAVKHLLPPLCTSHKVDFVAANGENIANGKGITPKLADDLFGFGVHVITTGNHLFDQKEILPYLQKNPRMLKPANYLPTVPGRGYWMGEVYSGVKVAVINLIGQIFMGPADNPFVRADQILKEIEHEADIILVDMHAEATSEKMAMGRYLDGRVSAVVGTHTHIPTADETIFPQGTAYLTDIGMCGPYDSVIGIEKEIAVQKFTTGIPARFQPAKGDARLSAVLIEIEESNGRARSIQRIQEKLS